MSSISSSHILSLVFSLLLTPAAGAAPICASIFTQPTTSVSELARLRIYIDQTKAKGSGAIEFTALSADYKRKEQELLKYFEQNGLMTPLEFTEKIKAEITLLQKKIVTNNRNKKDRSETVRRTKQAEQIQALTIDGKRAVFSPVSPAKFKFGSPGEEVDVTITKPFEMMATPVTRTIWKKVVENAPSDFSLDKQRAKEILDNDTHPIDGISYNDAVLWIRALNEMAMLADPLLETLIPGHKLGHRYRLPTEAEWELVAFGGPSRAVSPFTMSESEYSDYAWHKENSGGESQPVGQRKAVILEGQYFHDLHGNVLEWVADWRGDIMSGGTDPQGPAKGTDRVVRGASATQYISISSVTYRIRSEPHKASPIVGFRLVREMPSYLD